MFVAGMVAGLGFIATSAVVGAYAYTRVRINSLKNAEYTKTDRPAAAAAVTSQPFLQCVQVFANLKYGQRQTHASKNSGMQVHAEKQ